MGYGDLQRVGTLVGKINVAEALAVSIAKAPDTNETPRQGHLGDVILNRPDAIMAKNSKPSICIRKGLVVAKDRHMRRFRKSCKAFGYVCPQLGEVRDAAW